MTDDPPVIVAWAHSHKGGRCQHPDCRRVIHRGERIVKVDLGERGPQTSGHNGRGSWWCLDCGERLELAAQRAALAALPPLPAD